MADTVLIVEDEADLAGLLRDILQASGYDVICTTGSRAVARAEETRPAAIVLDYLMPGMNGGEVVEQLRETMRQEAPPVVLVTGLSNARELAEKMGASGHLRKPFNLDEFVSLIDRLAASGPAKR